MKLALNDPADVAPHRPLLRQRLPNSSFELDLAAESSMPVRQPPEPKGDSSLWSLFQTQANLRVENSPNRATSWLLLKTRISALCLKLGQATHSRTDIETT